MRIEVTMEEFEELREDYMGVCLACGAWRDCTEPDAREYDCEACGEHQVFGAEELLLMGRVAA